MLNQSTIKTESGSTRKTILVDELNSTAFSCMVANTGVSADDDERKIVKAGTPLNGDLEARGTAFTKAVTTSGTKGTWTCEITTAFASDEKITINGVEYTKGDTQSAADKIFAGSSATEQATSLVAIVSDPKFTLTNSSGVITFTQKVADTGGAAPTVTKTATTGAIGNVTAGTSPVDGTNNATCILLHDVDVTNGTKNAQAVVFGFIDTNKLDADVQVLITEQVKANLKMIQFVK